MSTYGDSLDTFLIGEFNDSVQSIRHSIMELIDTLTVGAGTDDGIIFFIEAGEQLLKEGTVGGRRVIKTCFSIPFTNAVFSSDFLRLWIIGGNGESFNGRENGLEATIEGRAEEAFNRRIKRLHMRGELVRLVLKLVNSCFPKEYIKLYF
jgi:hypothetical protein